MNVARGGLLAAALLAVALGAAPAGPAAPPPGDRRPDLLLVTLDTTRADALGCYGSAGAATPTLDAVAGRGVRYARAISASPLTLPAHASLLTGLDPPGHGLRDNGVGALPDGVPTLASVLAARGYVTAAFVASRVLDRRFGLDRGFGVYDDGMAAEQVGAQGYAERDAHQVTDAALAWARGAGTARPWFLWVHYYDPHAPYLPPSRWRRGTPRGDYQGEVAYVDAQLARLLAALPDGPRLVAVAGDHGESFGEHGEEGHGVFLYRPSLEVPLLLAGPGVPAGRVIAGPVATRALPASLLALLGVAEREAFGSFLPGLGGEGAMAAPIYSETLLPATAYGWAPLKAVTDGGWRLVVAPRAELYDTATDPEERRNLLASRPQAARRLRRALAALEAGMRRRAPAPVAGAEPEDSGERSVGAEPAARAEGADRSERSEQAARAERAELAASLRSLGYLSGASGAADGGGEPAWGSGLDPKDGLPLLADFEAIQRELAAGRIAASLPRLQELVRRNPGNVPFLAELARAHLALGDGARALAALERAITENPRLDFLHAHRGDALVALGRLEEAGREYRLTLELDPRSAGAWLGLGEIAMRRGNRPAERRILLDAVAAGTRSAAILARLAQLALADGELEAADAHLRRATGLAPGWAPAWLVWGDLAERQGRIGEARKRYGRAADLASSAAEAAPARERLQRLEGTDR